MNKNLDMLNGRLCSKILIYAVPLALTGILQQLFNASDVAVVGRFAGEAAMAAVGCNTPVVSFLVNLFLGLSLGSNVVISQLTGQGDSGGVSKAVHTSMVISVIGGVVIALIAEVLAAPILHLLGVPEDVYPMALLYLRVYIAGLPVIFLYNFEAAIYRSQGKTEKPLIALALSGVLNVGLNVFFVVVLDRKADGVALATVISNAVSAVILLVMLLHDQTAIRFEFSKMQVDPVLLKKIMQIGIPSSLQSCVFSVSNMCVQSAINSLGTVVIAASSAAFNIDCFSFFIINSFGQACTTFVGQNYGAGKEDRCSKTLKYSFLLDALFTLLICVAILAFGRPLLYLFNDNPEVIDYGIVRLQILVIGHLFAFQVEVFSGYLRGYGKSALPAAITVASVCGIRLIWVFAVFRFFHTFPVLMAVYPISLFVNAAGLVIATIVFVKKRKKADGVKNSL
ncbi:MAG: MATE family efflux transporter [Treponema sp.]|nr:MATE family efflux transporter [Treponema sp.]